MRSRAPDPEESPISREDTLAIMAALADILVEVRTVRIAIIGDDDEELEEDEP